MYISFLTVTIFEYDERFKTFGSDFVPYDYKFPLSIPRDMSNSYDLVIADPPFLSDECLTKVAITIKFLAKKNIILCTGILNKCNAFISRIYNNYAINYFTGAIMADLAKRLLDVKICNFIPCHQNNLANEFSCYANFDFDKTLE